MRNRWLYLVAFVFSLFFAQPCFATSLFYSNISTTPFYSWPLTSDFNPTVGTSTSSFVRLFDAAEQESSGLWLDVSHLVPRFSNGSFTSEQGANVNNNFFAYPASQVRNLTLSPWATTNMTVALNQTGVTTLTANGSAQTNDASSRSEERR